MMCVFYAMSCGPTTFVCGAPPASGCQRFEEPGRSCDDAIRMRIHVGTSGYNYPEWRGTFYPADLPAKQMFG